MTEEDIWLPPKLLPVFTGDAGVRGAYGGRGSGKTRSFAKMIAVRGYMFGRAGVEGQMLCAREHLNSLDDSSLEEIKVAIRESDWLSAYYEVGEKYVRSRDGRISFVFAGLRHNVDSVKSKARILICWVDEAENVPERSWQTLLPTLRSEGDGWQSELWVTWNPASEDSATHKRFRADPPTGAKIVEINWQHNPRFPAILEKQRAEDQIKRPDSYAHIWEGDFITLIEGAYYAPGLAEARKDGRIGFVPRDPLMEVRAYWDIGGTGARADATAIWLAQFVGDEVRWLDYYEASGQPLEAHVNWLRDRSYPVKTCVLPHDGAAHDKVYAVSYEGALRQAGFSVQVIPNQGRGAAAARIEAMRRLLPACRFASPACDAGIKALAGYHEKIDRDRNIGLGPEHDWASHGADAAGLVAIARARSGPTAKIPTFKPRSVA